MTVAATLIIVTFAILCCTLALWVIIGDRHQCDCHTKPDSLAGLTPDARRILDIP